MTALDPLKYRPDFPILDRKVNGKPMLYLDNAASAQTPKCVVETIDRIYYSAKANVHRGVHCLSQEATANMEASADGCANSSTPIRPTKSYLPEARQKP